MTIMIEPAQMKTLAEWVNTDDTTSPATIRINELSINKKRGKPMEYAYGLAAIDYIITAIYVNQGDDATYIDRNGNEWEWSDPDDNGEQFLVMVGK